MSDKVQLNSVQSTASTATKAAASDAQAGGDVFAALLDASGSTETTAATESTGTTDSTSETGSKPAAIQLDGLDTADLNTLEVDAGSATAIATAAAATGTAVDPEQLMADLVAALTQLDTALKNGETPDADLVKKINDGIDTLSELLDIPEPEKPQLLDTITALAGLAVTTLIPALKPPSNTPTPDQALEAAAATGGKAETPETPELTQLLTKIKELAETAKATDPALSEKLTAFAEKLEAAKIPPDLLARLNRGAAMPVETETTETQAATTQTTDTDTSTSAVATTTTTTQAAATTTTAETKAAVTLPPMTIQPLAAPKLAVPEKTALTAPEAVDRPEDAETNAPEAKPQAATENKPDRPADRPSTGSGSRQESAATAAVVATATDTASQNTAGTTQAGGSTVTQAQAAAALKALPAAYQTPQINMPQLAFEIVRQVQMGNSRFQIRLDPPELGRIDVKLDVDTSGNVNARLTVERSETLDLLQRDHRGLERALAQAGIDSGKTNLEFSLKQNPFERQNGGNGAAGAQGTFNPDGTVEAEEAQTTVTTLYRGTASAGGVNIFA